MSLIAEGDAALTAIKFAVAHPERVEKLVLVNGYATAAGPRFACIFQQGVAGPWVARHARDPLPDRGRRRSQQRAFDDPGPREQHASLINPMARLNVMSVHGPGVIRGKGWCAVASPRAQRTFLRNCMAVDT